MNVNRISKALLDYNLADCKSYMFSVSGFLLSKLSFVEHCLQKLCAWGGSEGVFKCVCPMTLARRVPNVYTRTKRLKKFMFKHDHNNTHTDIYCNTHTLCMSRTQGGRNTFMSCKFLIFHPPNRHHLLCGFRSEIKLARHVQPVKFSVLLCFCRENP